MPRKPYWSVQTLDDERRAQDTRAMAARARGDETFPWPAAEIEPTRVRVQGPTDAPYVVDVGFARDSEGEPVPVEVTVRRTLPMNAHKRDGEYRFTDDADLEPVSAVDLRAIPFGQVLRAALVAKKRPELSDERHAELDKILLPRGRPKRGRSEAFYRKLLAAAQQLEVAERGSSVKEIARRKRVSPNLVHQWLHVARRLEEES
jgi:hypothetical protein